MNELYHHGIKGQKWGVRRYQNPDGSLTSAGKRRRALAIAASPGGYAIYRAGKAIKNRREQAKREASYTDQQKHDIARDRMSDARTTYKYRKYLNDRELQDRVNRLNNEKKLKDLSNDEGYERYKQKAKDLVVRYGTTKVVSATLGPEAAAVVGASSHKNNKKKKR